MRVGLVCPYDLAAPGGVQAQVLGLARALRRLGHEVEVVAPGVGPPAEGVHQVGRSLAIPVNGSVAPMAPHPAAAARAVARVRRGGFDVVHLHEPLAPSITIPTLVARSAPVVATFHAAGDRTPYRWLGPLLRPLARRITVRTAVSEPAACLARRHLGGTYEVLFNGVDADEIRAVEALPAEGPTVLFLARHEPRKGLGVLLGALERLPGDVVVWVAGEPSRQRGEPTDPRVRWLGRLSETEKRRRLRSASVLCAPSLHGESFGLVLAEAMAAGTPVVASDVAGHRAAVGGSDAAVLVPAGDPDALAVALTRVLLDGALAARMRAAGSVRAAQLSMSELARRYVELYERVG